MACAVGKNSNNRAKLYTKSQKEPDFSDSSWVWGLEFPEILENLGIPDDAVLLLFLEGFLVSLQQLVLYISRNELVVLELHGERSAATGQR